MIVCTTGRKAVMETYIPRIYNTIKDHLIGDLADKDIIGCIATDGWKKKAAEQGTPLINFMVHGVDGGSFFWKVGTCYIKCTVVFEPD
jgi:hypothetical protein